MPHCKSATVCAHLGQAVLGDVEALQQHLLKPSHNSTPRRRRSAYKVVHFRQHGEAVVLEVQHAHVVQVEDVEADGRDFVAFGAD